MTNIDKISDMTDKELATLLYLTSEWNITGNCALCPLYVPDENCGCYRDPLSLVEKWIAMEVEV